MIKKYCDLCGREIDEGGERMEISLYDPSSRKRESSWLPDDFPIEDKSFDICPACKKRTVEFFKPKGEK